MYSELWDDIEYQLVNAIVLHKQAKENKPQRSIGFWLEKPEY